MCQTGLMVLGINGIASCVIVDHQISLEVRREDLQSCLSGTGGIDVKKTEVGVSRKQYVLV